MAIPVLLILAVLWAAFFVWPLIRGRSNDRQVDSIDDFSYRLGVIGRTGGHRRSGPVRLSPATAAVALAPARAETRPAAVANGAHSSAKARTRRRRRDVLMALAVGAVGTLALAVLLGGTVAWAVHLLVDAALVAYVIALVRIRQREAERRTKVRYLAPATAGSGPVLVLRRTASS